MNVPEIMGWLVGTWFFEGHHKRCQVDVLVTCKHCGAELQAETDCSAVAGGHVEER